MYKKYIIICNGKLSLKSYEAYASKSVSCCHMVTNSSFILKVVTRNALFYQCTLDCRTTAHSPPPQLQPTIQVCIRKKKKHDKKDVCTVNMGSKTLLAH